MAKKATKKGAGRKRARRKGQDKVQQLRTFWMVPIGPIDIDDEINGGVLASKPGPLEAIPGGTVIWLIRNDSSRKVTVRVEAFKEKASGKSYSPVKFHGPATVTVDAKSRAALVAEVTHKLKDPKKSEMFGYDIKVKAKGLSGEIDPDLEIIPPPGNMRSSSALGRLFKEGLRFV